MDWRLIRISNAWRSYSKTQKLEINEISTKSNSKKITKISLFLFSVLLWTMLGQHTFSARQRVPQTPSQRRRRQTQNSPISMVLEDQFSSSHADEVACTRSAHSFSNARPLSTRSLLLLPKSEFFLQHFCRATNPWNSW